MIDLEERISETLHQHAPVFDVQMPKGTVARVRLRQALASVVTLTIVAVVALGATTLFSAGPQPYQPGAHETVPPPSGELTPPQGETGGVNNAEPADVTVALSEHR